MEKPSTFALLASLFLALAPAAEAAEEACAGGKPEAVTVAAALDGDTLRLADGRVVRLAGVAAVKAAPDADEAVARLAETARARLADLAAGSGTLRAVGEGPDRYGRLHGDLIAADGRSVAAALVAAGMAQVRAFPGEVVCAVALLAAETEARRAERGLWALPSFAVRDAGDGGLLDRVGRFALVEGRVASVNPGRIVTFLDFGRDYRRDFTIMVPHSVAQRFAPPVDRLKGRRVRVRGVIEASGGPAIWLSDPTEIEILDEDDGGGRG